MNLFSKLVAILLVLVFIVSLPLSILAYDVGRVIFDPALDKQVLIDIATESDLFTVALQWYADRRAAQRYESGDAIAWQEEPDILDLLSLIEIDSWLAIRQEVLTDQILSDWIITAVDGFYQWLDSDQPAPEIVFDLASFKARVRSVHGRNAVQIIFDSLPPCTEEQIADFKSRLAAVPAGTKVPYNLCRFPDPWFDDQVSDYHQSVSEIVENIPAVFNLVEELSRNDQEPELAGIKERILTVRTVTRWAPVLPVILLLLILALVVRSLKALGNWWGIPLAVGGALLLLVALLYRSLITATLVSGPLQQVPTLVLQESIDAVTRLAEEVFRPLTWQSLVVFILGLILIVVGAAVKPNPEQTAAEALA